MSLLWIIVWLIVRLASGIGPQLHLLNVWLLALIVAAILDAAGYRTYVLHYHSRIV